MVSGVDRSRALTGLRCRPGSAPGMRLSQRGSSPDPMGSDNCGGGGTVGGGPTGAWRPRASASQTTIINKDRWLSGHIPSTRRERPS